MYMNFLKLDADMGCALLNSCLWAHMGKTPSPSPPEGFERIYC